MGFRFFRRQNVVPGMRLNFSKSGVSPSFGVRGARLTVGRQGVRKTVGVPGTGLFYTEVGSSEKNSGKKQSRDSADGASPQEQSRLDLGFFKRLFTPKQEQALVDGCREFVAGHPNKAMKQLRDATHLADGAFLAGFLALKQRRLDEAEAHLKQAGSRHRSLGKMFEKYGMDVELGLPITEFVMAHIKPCLRGVLLGLTEIHQLQGRVKDAMHCLKRLRRQTLDDVVINLSMAELVYEAAPNDRRLAKQIIDLAGDIENESSVHVGLMLYKARALRTLGLNVAARDVLTAAFRKKKDRDDDLLRTVQYERARVYEDLGKTSRARKEFEKLYAADPDFEDVAERLGV